MGQKISSYALRLGYNQTWNSSYFAPKKEQANWLKQDKLIRDYLFKSYSGITKIKIERTETELFVFAHTVNMTLMMGENNNNLDLILQKIATILDNKKIHTKFHLNEIKKIYSSAQSIANNLSEQITNRVRYRQACKKIVRQAMLENEVQGVKVKISGLLDGNKIARTELFIEGKMPTSTLDSIIEYGQAVAKTTTYGQIGIIIWLCKVKVKEFKNNWQNERNEKEKKYQRRSQWTNKNYSIEKNA